MPIDALLQVLMDEELLDFFATNPRYSFLRWLGQGGLCNVAEVWDAKFEVYRAAKVLRPLHHSSAEARDRLRQEGRLLARVQNPHVLGVYDILECPDVGPILIVEKAKRAWEVPAGPIPLEEGLGVAEQLLRGLSGIHEEGILHRDVKPGNLLEMLDHRIVLCDLSVGKGDVARRFETRAGETLGTLAYAAPEQLQDSASVTPAADVYGAGATLYRIFSGQRPKQLWRAETTGRRLTEVPAVVQQVVEHATRLNEKRRYTDGSEMLAAFRSAINAR